MGYILLGIILFVFVSIELSWRDRLEIEKKQKILEKENETLQAVIKEADRQRKEDYLKHVGEAEV